MDSVRKAIQEQRDNISKAIYANVNPIAEKKEVEPKSEEEWG